MKGKTLLKVTGILMIIGGIVMTILGLIAVLGVGALIALAEGVGADTNAAVLVAGAVLILLSGVFELIAGIAGVRFSARPEKAGKCLVYGIIIVVISILGNILNVIGGGSVNLFGLATGLALPVLYIIGACLNKQGADAAQSVSR